MENVILSGKCSAKVLLLRFCQAFVRKALMWVCALILVEGMA